MTEKSYDEIEISSWERRGDEYVVSELAAGRAVQFYCMDYRSLNLWRDRSFPMADVWYTERNGDPIGMWVPKGTAAERLPSRAMDYMALEWIDPDKNFGSGVEPLRWRDERLAVEDGETGSNER